VTRIYTFINFLQHQTPGFECRRLWIERRQTRSDQISIDESERLSFGWQKVTSEGRFACAVRSCNDDDFFKRREPLI